MEKDDCEQSRKTIESMINCNMLDRNLTTEQVKSVLTDAHEEATKLGQEPEWDVSELTKCWLRFYDYSQRKWEKEFTEFCKNEAFKASPNSRTKKIIFLNEGENKFRQAYNSIINQKEKK